MTLAAARQTLPDTDPRAVVLRRAVVVVAAASGAGFGIGMADVEIAVLRVVLAGLVVMLALLASSNHHRARH
jgi:hypothetical protein